jgi:ribosomal protein S18 acetylase RimI-like enzyme
MATGRGDLTIRRADPGDAARLAAIHRDARAAAMPWLAVLHDAAETEAWMREHVIANQEVRVAVIGGAIVGFMALEGAELEQLYVAPRAQGRGVGTALLDLAKRSRPEGFSLWVFARNARARAFYERHGLVAIERTDGRTNEEQEPDVRYFCPGGMTATPDRETP